MVQAPDNRYRLYAVRVFVRDFDAAIDFYTNALGMRQLFCDREIGWAELDAGGARLALERATDDEGRALIGRFVGVSLQVDDIDDTYRELTRRGVDFDEPPQRQSWGGTLAHLRDPEGNVITLLG